MDGQPVRMDVFSDVACPWCFVGFRNLQRRATAWDGPPPKIHWRAFQLQPDHPPRGMPFGNWSRRSSAARSGTAR